MDGDLDLAVAGQSVTLTLADEIDASRGDLVCAGDAPAEVADQFEAHVVWMHEDPMLPGRPYLMKVGCRTVGVTIGHPTRGTDWFFGGEKITSYILRGDFQSQVTDNHNIQLGAFADFHDVKFDETRNFGFGDVFNVNQKYDVTPP